MNTLSEIDLTRLEYWGVGGGVTTQEQTALIQQARAAITAQARIRTLETALENITDGYIHETSMRWGVSREEVEKAPLVVAAREVLQEK